MKRLRVSAFALNPVVRRGFVTSTVRSVTGITAAVLALCHSLLSWEDPDSNNSCDLTIEKIEHNRFCRAGCQTGHCSIRVWLDWRSVNLPKSRGLPRLREI